MQTECLLANLKEIRAFFRVLHEQYGEAFSHEDLTGVIETSGELSAAYGIVGNMPLARKWAEEHRVSLCRLNPERSASA